MKHGELSEWIRKTAAERYVQPAISSGKRKFSIEVKALMGELEPKGFPPNHPAQFCTAVQTRSFLIQHGLEIERVDGPPSKKSTTVVVHYRIVDNNRTVPSGGASPGLPSEDEQPPLKEDSAAWAKRVTSKMAGLLKDEIAAYGGGDAFMKWIRSDGEEDE